MGVPWLSVIDTLIGVADLALGRRPGRRAQGADGALLPGGNAFGHLETRLAGVVVAALKEAFERDNQRLDLEREQIEAERQRAERALRLELLRQAGDREINRLRLIAGVAVLAWIVTLFLGARLLGESLGARVVLGSGWLLLLGALASALSAQASVTKALSRIDVRSDYALEPTAAATLAPWLVITGLALVGVAVLI